MGVLPFLQPVAAGAGALRVHLDIRLPSMFRASYYHVWKGGPAAVTVLNALQLHAPPLQPLASSLQLLAPPLQPRAHAAPLQSQLPERLPLPDSGCMKGGGEPPRVGALTGGGEGGMHVPTAGAHQSVAAAAGAAEEEAQLRSLEEPPDPAYFRWGL